MRLPNPICWWERIWRSIKTFQNVGGHQLREESRLNHCIVTVLKCDRCDYYHIGWEPTARSTYEPYPDQRSAVTEER